MSSLNVLHVLTEPVQQLVDRYLLEGPVHRSTWMLLQVGGSRPLQLLVQQHLHLAPDPPPESRHLRLVSNSMLLQPLQALHLHPLPLIQGPCPRLRFLGQAGLHPPVSLLNVANKLCVFGHLSRVCRTLHTVVHPGFLHLDLA